MKTRIIASLLTAFFLFTCIISSYSQNVEQLFQKGLMQEEGEGNLSEAINTYNSIVENQNAEPTIQAKALLHVGLCYEKMGKEEATKAYQKLVNNFPSQKNEVAIARERLSRLILEAEKLADKSEQVKTYTLTNKKIWDESDTDLDGAISPDGKYLSYVDWDTGDLAIYEVSSGNKRRLTNKGTWDKSDTYAEYSRWFPDSKKIIYLWFNEEQFAELRTISLDNPEPQILIKDKDLEWAEIYDCSLDGEYILACLDRKSDEGVLTIISANDGSEKALKSSYTSNAAFSPDRRFVMYDSPQESDKSKTDIYIYDLNTEKETKLIEHPADDRLLGRIPNKNEILFVSDRTGTPDFWSIKVENGKPVEAAKFIKNNSGPFWPTSLGFTDNNIFYYGELRNRIDIYEMEIDPLSGRIIETPSKIVEKYIGCNGTPDYSEDGKYLAYVSRRPPGKMRFTTNPVGNVLCIRSLETGKEKEFRLDLNEFGFPQWSPDGQYLMVVEFDKQGNLGYYQINAETGHAEPVLLGTGRNIFGGHYYSIDGRILYHGIRDEKTNKYKLVERNLEEKTENVLYESDSQFALALSPEKKYIAILSNADKSLKIIPVKGGEINELFNPEDVKDFRLEDQGNMFTWSSDGNYLFFADRLSQKEGYGWNLYRVSVKDGKIDKLGLKSEGHFVNLNAHPDGRHLVYSARGKSNSEVWMMENFLPSNHLTQKSNEGANKEPEGIQIRQIWKSPYLDDLGTVSQDGKFRSYVNWGIGNVAIHNLITNENRVLTDKASMGDTTYFALSTAISKSGRKIASSWWKPNNTTDLVLTDVNNPSMNILYSKKGEEVYPYQWLSENEFVGLRSIPDERKTQIITFNMLNKTIKVKKNFNEIQDIQLACSPDEKYIAYNYTNNGNLDINILSANGDLDIPLIRHPANDKVLGWLPGANEFFFLSDRSGTWDLWTVNLYEGKTFGEEKRIYSDIGDVLPMGFTKDGKCYFGFVRRNFSTNLTSFDSQKGLIEKGSGESLKGSNFGMAWSPDGQYLAYINLDNEKTGHIQLIVRDLKTGEEHAPLNNVLTPLGFKWSPHGNSVLVVALETNQNQPKGYIGGVFKVDVGTGQTEKIFFLSDYKYSIPDDDAYPLSGIEWAPDGNSFYYLFFKDRLVKHNLKTNDDKILYSYSDFSRNILDLSPNGKSLLFGLEYPNDKKSRLVVIPVEGGEVKEICTAQDADDIYSAFWSPDGKYIYFVEVMQSTKTNLWRVPSEGGNPEKTWSSENRVEIYDIHPDGNQVAFSIRERTTEIRVIEGLVNELNKIYSQNE